MEDQVLIAVNGQGNVRIYACLTTKLVEEARRRHDLSPTAAAALGRALTAVSLMGPTMKDEEKVTLRIMGDGPLGTIISQGNREAAVRGYVENPDTDLPPKSPGKLDVGSAVGRNGFLHVVRDKGFGAPYTGSVQLVSGEIAEDLTQFYAVSEQTPSAVALGVLVDIDGSIKAAGGFLVQAMPGASDDDLEQLEKNIAQLSSISHFIAEGRSVRDIIDKVMEQMSPSIIGELRPSFACLCNRERLKTILQSLGIKEMQEMIEEQGGAEATCHFCNQQYLFNKEDLQEMILEVEQKQPSKVN